MDSMLDHAVAYGENNYRVFPCHYPLLVKNSPANCSCGSQKCKPGKHPMIRDWTHLASNDPDQIRHWWTRQPYANIGLLTGEPNGFDVLDEDPKDGGDVALREKIDIYGDLPPTPRSRTGSGGEHFLFRHHRGLKNNNHGKIAKGLDFRTTGGQIIAPPSLHASGRRYEWVNPHENLADPPQWLLDAMRDENAQSGRRLPPIQNDEWQRIARGVSGGDRHNALLRLAGHLLATLPSKHLAITLIHAYNQFCCDEPKPPEEVNSIVNFILRKRIRKFN